MKFQDGEVIADRYQVLNYHAAGGMQEVYRCLDKTLNRVVALKTPKEGIVDKRFSRGAQMGARVTHPNVAATLDYVEQNGMRCLIEEFIEGQDLSRRLQDEFEGLDPSLTAWVIHHIAKGLHAAHKVGICHRDLKPSNVMTSGDSQLQVVKLTDFGIAKLAQRELEEEMERFDQDENTLTSSSTLLGAVPYLAPECWADWKTAGQPADIWALGAITYHLLVGKTPFGGGKSAIAKMLQAQQTGVVELKPPPWFGAHPSTKKLEKELWDVIVSCLVVDPTKRPSADDVVSAFEVMCYAAALRRKGTVETYPITYANGSKATAGFILVDGLDEKWFFHASDFYGTAAPKVGQRVSFSSFDGKPYPRCAPVLLIK
jgi:eukaryotic-like serine/threonine-protein kinase